jgi:hypothetical protein
MLKRQGHRLREEVGPMARCLTMTRDRAAIVAAIAGPLALAAILLPWRGSWSNTNVALLLVVVVVAVACMGNRLAGALAALSAAVWFDFFYTLPYNRLTIRHSADVTTFVLLLAVGVAVSQLAAKARRLRAVTLTDAGYFERIVDSAALTQAAGTPYDVIEHVRRQLIDILELLDCRYEAGKLLGHPPRLEQDGRVATQHGYWPVDEFGFPEEDVELRTFSGGQYVGRFILVPRPGSRPSAQARLVAVALADLAAHALVAGAANVG